MLHSATVNSGSARVLRSPTVKEDQLVCCTSLLSNRVDTRSARVLRSAAVGIRSAHELHSAAVGAGSTRVLHSATVDTRSARLLSSAAVCLFRILFNVLHKWFSEVLFHMISYVS